MGLKEIYYKIEDKYYGLIEWLANNGLNFKPLVQAIETKGIPSLPLFTALLLIIVGGAYLYTNPAMLQGISGSTNSLTIRVQTASNEPLADALVAITGVNVDQSSITAADGTVSFTGISPGVRLRISVSKDGFSAVSRELISGASLPPFILRTGGDGDQVTLLVVTTEGSPIGQAQVSYIVNGEARDTQTSSQGVAQLSVAIGTPVSITVNAQGFETATQSFTPDSPGYQQQITLASSSLGSIEDFGSLAGRSQRVPSPNDDEETDEARSINLADDGTVTVNVANSTSGGIQGATVALFNNADHSQLGTGTTNVNGTAVFRDIATGIQAYVAVDADGYVSQVSPPRVTQSTTTFSVSMTVVSNLTSTNLTITFTDDAGTTTFSGLDFALFQFDSTTGLSQRLPSSPATGSSRTRTLVNLPAGETVYLSAYTLNHVRYASETFTLTAGTMPFQANLTKKTIDNAVDVRVSLVDFYNDPVLRGTVTPYLSSNNHVLYPNVSTASAGVFILKNIPVATSILVKATNTSFFGEASITVSLDNTNVTVRLLPTTSEVKLNALDVFDNHAISDASFTVSYTNAGQSVVLGGCGSNSGAPSPTEFTNGVCGLTFAS
ncbi:MAG: carboxypeptidase-like regulatory domain-containing protein, partial [Candidatus Micrarchaeota archaeon]|nr:carboxypeptidase-like regulatory domain-containing protein [Candidatus Micrarchaeota archaeon]